MSILAQQADAWRSPEPGFTPIAGRWMVLWTKPRQEKAVARYLEAVSAQFYLPLVERVSFSRDRKLVSRVPLFPGYIFVAGELEDAYAAVSTKRICQVLQIPDQATFIHEIEQVDLALTQGGSIDLYPFAVIGRRCRVVRGPFIGIEGVITERLGPARLVLQVAILGQGAALEIDTDLLEPVE